MLRLSLLALFALAVATPTFALAEAAPAKDAAAHPAAAHDTESPAVSVSGLKRYDLGIYTLVVFGLLFLILAKFAYKPFVEGLNKREAGIIALKDEAVKAKHDAEEIRAKLNAEFASAQDKIRAMMDEARRDADVLRAEEKERGVKDAMTERERAKREIESSKDQALQEIQQQAVKLATLISSKAMRRSVTIDDQQRLVTESLAELNATVKA